MARLDRKHGRFTSDLETNQINDGLQAWQQETGTEVFYYRYDPTRTQVHDIYDEGFGIGKVYLDPKVLPVLHAIHDEGLNENLSEGTYWNDNLHCTASFEQVRHLGLTDVDIITQAYLNDRIVYDDKVFRVMRISVLGQIQNRDVIVSIEASQVKPDELVNDQQFARFASVSM